MVKPFTEASVDESAVFATKGEPISEAILYAKNRNEALASLAMSALDKLTLAFRQARQFETARREIPKRQAAFRRAIDIGNTFAEGGQAKLAEAIIDFCLDRANGPATQLGRLRKRLEERKIGAANLKKLKPTDAKETPPESNEPGSAGGQGQSESAAPADTSGKRDAV